MVESVIAGEGWSVDGRTQVERVGPARVICEVRQGGEWFAGVVTHGENAPALVVLYEGKSETDAKYSAAKCEAMLLCVAAWAAGECDTPGTRREVEAMAQARLKRRATFIRDTAPLAYKKGPATK